MVLPIIPLVFWKYTGIQYKRYISQAYLGVLQQKGYSLTDSLSHYIGLLLLSSHYIGLLLLSSQIIGVLILSSHERVSIL